MVKLRKYQKEAVSAIGKEWNDHRATMLVQATGTGKTIVFAECARRLIAQNKKVLILAHRDELLSQAQDKLSLSGIKSVLEKAKFHTAGLNAPVTVASVQSLGSDKRLKEFKKDKFSTIIIDEAHHSLSPTYQKILDYFDQAKVLGVTATPYRGDKKSLAKVFDSVAYEYPLDQAIKDNYLCPIKIKMLPLSIDLSRVKISAGDYQAGDLGHTLTPYLNQIADIMRKECKGRKTVVFLPLIETSKTFCEILKEKGFRAAEVNGQSENRKEILEAFDRGEIDVLCNAMLLTEGWDCPSVDCIINLRPTRSNTLYTQIIGRGTRIAPNKENLLVLDFLWQTTEHNLCRPIDLTAKDEKVKEKAEEIIETGKAIDLLDLTEEAEERSVREERERNLAKRLGENKKKRAKTIDWLDFATRLNSVEIMNYEPVFKWESEPMTQKQKDCLKRNNFNVDTIKNKGHAAVIINKIVERGNQRLCTPKQLELLNKNGFRAEAWTFEQASSMIGLIAKNHWKVPNYIDPQTYQPGLKKGANVSVDW